MKNSFKYVKLVYMKRFFVKYQVQAGEVCIIDGIEHNHIKNVMRMSVGDTIILVCGDEYDYYAQIVAMSKGDTKVQILRKEINNHNSEVHLTVFQAMTKSDNMSLIVQKLTELGVKTFMSAGNSTEIINNKFYDAINLNLLAKGTRGVGALDETGKKIAEYSSSRKSNLTQNYENGTVLIEFRDKGLNITSSKGIDIPYNQKTKELLREILDLTPNSPELKKIDDEIYQYKDVYLYRCDNDFTPYVIQITGTSWATPRRVAEYTKYKQFQNLLE